MWYGIRNLVPYRYTVCGTRQVLKGLSLIDFMGGLVGVQHGNFKLHVMQSALKCTCVEV